MLQNATDADGLGIAQQGPAGRTAVMTAAEKRVVLAASLGTAFEWYDFFLVGSLAAEIAKTFFSGVNPTAGFIFTLLGFAVGFAVRPFGALFFGCIGDMLGRKYTFLATILLMGAATFAIGLLPSYAAIGIASPILFLSMRILQGLAIGGEYGGAVIYVAEHAPNERRGAWTSWVVVTATVGFLLSFAVILPSRAVLGDAEFARWGWRIPFLCSFVLLLISVWIRLRLNESPEFARMKAQGRTSRAPIAESFGQWKNLKPILIALIGIVPGQAVVWYTGQFYTLFFLTKLLHIDTTTATGLIVGATLITAPLYILFGRLSDRIGRKPVYLTGCLCGAALFVPLFTMLTHYANPALEKAQREAPIVVAADPAECAFQFDPTGTAKFASSCDIARSSLAKAGMSYSTVAAAPNARAEVRVGDEVISAYAASEGDAAAKAKSFNAALSAALTRHGYVSGTADPGAIDKPMVLILLVALLSFGTMTFAPMSSMLVELFPSRIRYTAMSFPYHLGVAWFGGFLPATAFAIVAATGNILAGLWYPAGVAAFSFLVVLLFARETRGVDIYQT